MRAAHAAVRRVAAELTEDRPLYKDIKAVDEIIANGELIRAVEAAVGPLR